MAQGTGLTLPKEYTAQTTPTGVSGVDSGASSWGRIAAIGESIAKSGFDVLRLEEHQRQVGYLSETEIADDRKRIELRDQFEHDPKGFDAAWEGYTQGALKETEPWAINHRRTNLGKQGNSAFSTILSETRSRDRDLAKNSYDALNQTAGSEAIGLAMAGKIGTPEGQEALTKFRNVVQTGVTSGFISQEEADRRIEDTFGRAQGEQAAKIGVDVYREKGFAAATEYLRKEILENDKLSIKPGARNQIFARAVAAVRLAEKEDKADQAGVVEMARDLRARISSNQDVDPGEVRETLASLGRTGSIAEYNRLSAAVALRDATAPYRTGSVPLGEFAGKVKAMRGAGAPAAQDAYKFFMTRGYSPAQAAGIVGNLVHESGMRPDVSHDAGTGIGIAGWRLERRDALKRFAAARGKTETDFQTQLEFVDHELKTTESGAYQALQKAQTPKEAAAAFIHFERPLGYSQGGNVSAAHGYSSRLANADAVAGTTSPDPTMPPMGEVTRQAQKLFVEQARKVWPEMERMIEQGRQPTDDDFQAIRYAAELSGDADWIKKVTAFGAAQGFSEATRGFTQTQKQTAVDQTAAALGEDGWNITEDTAFRAIEKNFQREQKMVAEDPVGYAVEKGAKPPPPLDLSSPDAARASVAARVEIARRVAAGEGVPAGNPLRPADRAAIAGAIATGKPAQAAAAFDALASLPDEFLLTAFDAKDVKDAVSGAIRTGDPAKFGSAMSFLDRMWQRAPATTKETFGEDSIHQLMTWQSNLRYMTPDQLAEERKRSTLDPQVRERRKVNEAAAREIVRKLSPDEVVKQFDTSWALTPGFIARGIGTQPAAPVDALTRDALMADYEAQFVRRYAETLDQDVAHQQTAELLSVKWAASPINGGRLMLRAPETVYPAIDGDHSWMKDMIEADLTAKLGPRFGATKSDPVGAILRAAPFAGPDVPNWNYVVVSDRTTETDVQGRKPASYQVVVFDGKTGRPDVLKREDGTAYRYSWDPEGDQAKDREARRFEIERRRTFGLGTMQAP